MKVFYQALAVHLIFNIYVFIRGREVLPPKKAWQISWAILFLAELIAYLVGFIVNTSLPHDLLKPIALLGTTWMIFIGYLSALLIVFDITKFLSKKYPKLQKLHLNKMPVRRGYFIASLIFVVCSMVYGNYKFHHPSINNYKIAIDKKAGDLSQLRVVMVSDIHLGYLIDKDILKQYVDLINSQKPDVVVMVGDIIDYDLPPLVKERMDEDLSQLKTKYGVFLSTGNHEYRLNAQEKIAWLGHNTGITVLRDSVAKIADAVYIIGREDHKCPTRKSLQELVKAIDPSLPTIVLKHQPKELEEETEAGIDIGFYGHTHNGQLFPYNLLVKLAFKVAYGYKKIDNTHIYVSSGLGLAGPQYRIGTESEIAVFDLTFKQ